MRPFFRYLKEGIKFAFRHPIQGLEEAMAISQVQLEDTLQELHNNGVGIAIVSGVNDPVFPMKRLQKIVKRNISCGVKVCNYGRSYSTTPLDKSLEEYENEIRAK